MMPLRQIVATVAVLFGAVSPGLAQSRRAFDEAREPLKGAPYVWDEPTGRGHVTLFADDPAFRTFLHGAHRLLLNAILLGPSL